MPNSAMRWEEIWTTWIDKTAITCVIGDWLLPPYDKIPPIEKLYCRGNRELLYNSQKLWVVWPRNMSWYGERVLRDLFVEMRNYSIVTVSGGAFWVDTYAHMQSIAQGIPTIVVLAGGIEWYRRSWKVHYLEKIVQSGGLVISEYPTDQSPQKYTFPMRNRIIAGLSKVLFVPEASKKSWSLHTVRRANQFHVPVYAPMNSIYAEQSEGTNLGIALWNIQPILDMGSVFRDNFTANSVCKPDENIQLLIKENPGSVNQLIECAIIELWL